MSTTSSAPGHDPLAGPGDGDAGRRAEVRAFIRLHHPDVGGDPEEFRAGLARLRAGPGSAAAVDPPAAPGWSSRGGPADDDPRLDAPIVGVRHVTLHRIGRLGRRLARRCDPRPGSARVR